MPGSTHLRRDKCAGDYGSKGSRSRYWLPESPANAHLRGAALSLHRRRGPILSTDHTSAPRIGSASPGGIYFLRVWVAHRPSCTYPVPPVHRHQYLQRRQQRRLAPYKPVFRPQPRLKPAATRSPSEHIELLLMAGFRANTVALWAMIERTSSPIKHGAIRFTVELQALWAAESKTPFDGKVAILGLGYVGLPLAVALAGGGNSGDWNRRR